MIFVTGDLHAEIDISKLNNRNFKESKNLTKDDFIIITGDFGLVWDGSKTDEYWLNWLNQKPYTVLFVDGNHENFELLNSYPISDWNGGNVHKIKESVIHLMRGQIYTISGYNIFTFGGANSTDKEQRIEHISWWKEEYPNYMEIKQGIEILDMNNWEVDYIFTHTCPTSILFNIPDLIEQYKNPTQINEYFEMIKTKALFKHWYFGHFHRDITLEKKFTIVYQKIIQIN